MVMPYMVMPCPYIIYSYMSFHRFTKKNVSPHEAEIYQRAQSIMDCVPRFISYDPETMTMITEKIPQMNIADMYGESGQDMSIGLWKEIKDIIIGLYQNGIEYSDITGYNFIEHAGKVWIIDFGHAQYIQDIEKNGNQVNDFVIDFMNGIYKWNPDFR